MVSADVSSTSQETYRPANDSEYPYISYGLPFHVACTRHVDQTFHASHVYLIVSGSLARNTNAVSQLQDALGDKVVGTRYGMAPHTLWSEVLEVSSEASALGTDLLLTLGAGSLTDAAKLVSLAIANNATTFDALERLHGPDWNSPPAGVHAPTVPTLSVPTSLSGGEYSHVAGATHDLSRRKYGFGAPARPPALVVLDAALTRHTPPRVWLASGVRALDHCVEALCSLRGSAPGDACARKGLARLAPNLLRCARDGGDVAARGECQLGVVDAMNAVFHCGVPMGASHGIGHQLGPLGVGHGETSCVLLPAVCKYNASANAARQEKVRELLWADPEVERRLAEGGLSRETADLGDMLDVIIIALGMPRSLKAVGVGSDKLEMLAENALHDHWCQSNPRPLTDREQVMEILQMVLG